MKQGTIPTQYLFKTAQFFFSPSVLKSLSLQCNYSNHAGNIDQTEGIGVGVFCGGEGYRTPTPPLPAMIYIHSTHSDKISFFASKLFSSKNPSRHPRL